MGVRAPDIVLCVTAASVTASCTHCEWRSEVSTAPWGVDLVRQARLSAMEHAWAAHKVHAWDLKFAYT